MSWVQSTWQAPTTISNLPVWFTVCTKQSYPIIICRLMQMHTKAIECDSSAIIRIWINMEGEPHPRNSHPFWLQSKEEGREDAWRHIYDPFGLGDRERKSIVHISGAGWNLCQLNIDDLAERWGVYNCGGSFRLICFVRCAAALVDRDRELAFYFRQQMG